MQVDEDLAFLVDLELNRVFQDLGIACGYVEGVPPAPGPALEIWIQGSPATLLWFDNDGPSASDEAIDAILANALWPEPESPFETAILIEALVLWWAHIHHELLISNHELNYFPSILKRCLDHWSESFESLGVGFIAEVASRWKKLAEEYGFEFGLQGNTSLGKVITDQLQEASNNDLEDDDSFIKSFFQENGQGIEVLNSMGTEVSREANEREWQKHRRNGVTATDAMKLLRKNGKPSKQRIGLLRRKVIGDADEFFEAYKLGVEREPIIASALAEQMHDLYPNDVLYHGRNPRHLATPDMIGDGYLVEIKVSSSPIEAVQTKYFDQIQWQLHVIGFSKALLVCENRHSQELESAWVARDEERIMALAEAADTFLEVLDRANAIWDADFEIEDWDFFDKDTGPIENTTVHDYKPLTLSADARLSVTQSTTYQPASRWAKSNVYFQDLDDDTDEDFSDYEPELTTNVNSGRGSDAAAGNPVREIRIRCGVKVSEFREEFGFAKMTMVYLESGMYRNISERQEQAIINMCRKKYFDLRSFLRDEYQSETLNEAYKSWQDESRKSLAGPLLAESVPPFPFTKEKSPLALLIEDNFGSVQRFCKLLKVQSITVTRYLNGETSEVPTSLVDALEASEYAFKDAFLDAQQSWVQRYRRPN